MDPELGLNIVDLGLVYTVDVQGDRVDVAMTMTAPGCPVTSYLDGVVTIGGPGTLPCAG